jgi:hypothetical protein
MSGEEFSDLIKRIYQELEEIQLVLVRITAGWEHVHQTQDEFYIDSVALNLHGFYSGFERVFIQIAETVDGDLPYGENWHELLLQQMGNEIAGVRPAVISTESRNLLNEHRRFRHIVRNVYTHHFDPDRIRKLVNSASIAFEHLKAELSAFADFLDRA